MIKKVNHAIKHLIILLFILLSIISINHSYDVFESWRFTTFSIGLLGWITLGLSIYYLSISFLKRGLFIFIVFFCLGYFSGPFLEPPGDPIDHLSKSYSFISQTSDKLVKKNGGFWTYSMNHLFLPKTHKNINPDSTIRRINVLNGIYFGLLMVGLFILAKSSNLPDNWAFLSCLVAFLFFGTNRFSYFSYYSLSPSALSMLIYWLWISVFFFKRKLKTVLAGVIISLLLVPIIIVNHVQEAVFLGFITLLWVLININAKVFKVRNKDTAVIQPDNINHSQANIKNRKAAGNPKIWLKLSYVVLLLIILWILPQFDFVQNIISKIFVINDWKKNQELIYSWNGLHLSGRIWASPYRVNDTLGIVGILPAVLSIFILWPKFILVDSENKNRILILGILPLLVYCIPLFNFIWLSNCKWTPTHIRYYYRFCYSSIFWITIVYFLYGINKKILEIINKLHLYFRQTTSHFIDHNSFTKGYFLSCFTLILLMGCFRSPPIYGKLDFLSLNSKPWWEGWRPMIKEVIDDKDSPILSDRATLRVINGVFNIPQTRKLQGKIKKGNLDIERLCKVGDVSPYRFIINLIGFEPSWVPYETLHWSPEYADPFVSYRYRKLSGEKLIEKLENTTSENCDVYY